MIKKIIHNLSINDLGDVISIETFISQPEALAIEEQQALLELNRLLQGLQMQTNVESIS